MIKQFCLILSVILLTSCAMLDDKKDLEVLTEEAFTKAIQKTASEGAGALPYWLAFGGLAITTVVVSAFRSRKKEESLSPSSFASNPQSNSSIDEVSIKSEVSSCDPIKEDEVKVEIKAEIGLNEAIRLLQDPVVKDVEIKKRCIGTNPQGAFSATTPVDVNVQGKLIDVSQLEK